MSEQWRIQSLLRRGDHNYNLGLLKIPWISQILFHQLQLTGSIGTYQYYHLGHRKPLPQNVDEHFQ